MVTADVYITLNSVLYEQNGCSGVRNIFRLQLNLVNISNIISRPPFFNSLNFKVIIINIKYLVFIWIAFPAYAVFNILSKLLILLSNTQSSHSTLPIDSEYKAAPYSAIHFINSQFFISTLALLYNDTAPQSQLIKRHLVITADLP